MDNVRIGVIGYGNMGTSHAKWLHAGMIEGACLSAICDNDSAHLDNARNAFGGDVQYFDDYKKLIDSGSADAVIIAVPHYFHPSMAIYAMQHGLHAMVEKPAGVYTKQVKEMNDEAAKHPDLVYGMMFNQRMNPLYIRIKEMMDEHIIGDIRRVSWLITSWWRTQKYYDSSAWRATWEGEGGGVLMNQAPHQLDLLQWITGMPCKMHAHLKYGSHRDIDVEDDVTAYFEYPNGATGTLITCTHDAVGTDRLEIHGDNGKIIIEDSSKVTVKKLRKSEEELNRTLDFRQMLALVKGQAGEKLYDEEHFEIPENWEKQHVDVLINFSDAIRNGTKLVAPGSDGIKAVEIADSMYLSDWLGKEVMLPVDDDLFYSELQKRVEEEKAGRK